MKGEGKFCLEVKNGESGTWSGVLKNEFICYDNDEV
jgi:hypothetical protein